MFFCLFVCFLNVNFKGNHLHTCKRIGISLEKILHIADLDFLLSMAQDSTHPHLSLGAPLFSVVSLMHIQIHDL